MNIVFLTQVTFISIEERGIYQDLMRKFRDEGHHVYIVTPYERRLGLKTCLVENEGVHILNVKTLNIQKTNFVEKGIGTLLLETQYKRAIKKYLKGVRFDLITYSTPPITFLNVVKYLKKENPMAMSYLQLKDIFPQNAVDLEMLHDSWSRVHGIMDLGRYLLYKYFSLTEKRLYESSDYIGCMSPANVEYVLKHNTEISPNKVEVAPNSVELQQELPESDEHVRRSIGRNCIRKKYNLPLDKPIFIYGGNLGRPQGIHFLIDCLEVNGSREDCHFIVIGTGTELPKLQAWYKEKSPRSVTVMKGLPKTEYEELVKACDVGLIFLEHRFTIPNYPSRLLSYLENKMPVLCATDTISDIGPIAERNGYGYWCESNSVEAFTAILEKMINADREKMGTQGFLFMKKNYLVEHTYNAIMRHFEFMA